MSVLYVLIVAILLALLLPVLVDFLYILNRMAVFSPLKNNISQANIYALKKELRQVFLKQANSTVFEFILYSALLFLNFCVFFFAVILIVPVSDGWSEQIIIFYIFALPLAHVLMTILKRQACAPNNFPALLSNVLFKLSATSLISCFMWLSSQRGPLHLALIAFLFGLQFFFYFAAFNGDSLNLEQRPFRRHCFSGARIGLNFLTLMLLFSRENLLGKAELLIYSLAFSVLVELLSKISRTTWAGLDKDMIIKGKKAIEVSLIISLIWRLAW